MPAYDYRCSVCSYVTEGSYPMARVPRTIACEQCGAPARKIITGVSVKLSNLSKTEKLDPKYDKMVDAAMRKTTSADPDNYLKKMRSFGDAPD